MFQRVAGGGASEQGAYTGQGGGTAGAGIDARGLQGMCGVDRLVLLDRDGRVQNYADIAYGWAMEDTTGFAKLLADPRSGQLLGAHIIGAQAPTLLQPLIQAMSFGLDARSMARGQYWIHPALPELVENALLALPLKD